MCPKPKTNQASTIKLSTMSTAKDLNVHSIEKKYSYRLGDPAKLRDMRTSDLEMENAMRASLLKRGDGAFVRRSDNTWSFAIVTHNVLGEKPCITLILDKKRSKKILSFKRWASGIRCIQSSAYTPTNSTPDYFIEHIGSCLAIAEKTKRETDTGQCLNELFMSFFQVLSSEEELSLDDSQRTSEGSSGSIEEKHEGVSSSIDHNHPLLPEVAVSRQVRKNDIKSNPDCSCSSAATKSVSNDSSDANTKEDLDLGKHGKRRSSDARSSAHNSQASEVSDYSSHKRVTFDQTRRKMSKKAVTLADKTNEEPHKIQSFERASVKCQAGFQSLFEEFMQQPVE